MENFGNFVCWGYDLIYKIFSHKIYEVGGSGVLLGDSEGSGIARESASVGEGGGDIVIVGSGVVKGVN